MRAEAWGAIDQDTVSQARRSIPAWQIFVVKSIDFVSTMTTAVDRRRIPGPPSSYPALPLSSYTSTPSPWLQSSQQRNRASHEPRKICSSSSVSSSNSSPPNKSHFFSPRLRIHRNIFPINSSFRLRPRPASTPSQHTIYPNPATQHHFLSPPLQRPSSPPQPPWS